MKKFSLDVFVPDHSKGLMVDALVIKEALGTDVVRIICVPAKACKNTIDENDRSLRFEPEAEVAVFIERLFPHGNFRSYSKRVLLPNAEWLTAADIRMARGLIDEIWHKSRFGLEVLNNGHLEKPRPVPLVKLRCSETADFLCHDPPHCHQDRPVR